jgi:hypothetical protein
MSHCDDELSLLARSEFVDIAVFVSKGGGSLISFPPPTEKLQFSSPGGKFSARDEMPTHPR